MKNAYDTIIRPYVTEKSMKDSEKGSKYVFIVQIDANKIEIKNAVEKLFAKVKVKNVRTVTKHGKFARYKFGSGYRSDWKKAIVTLKEGRINMI
ncbi:MAG: 50S ribosomal protein L23 [Planctomycetes bacterium]|nr:50S ribosomal protein L23 [Planctomycetota bacterium]